MEFFGKRTVHPSISGNLGSTTTFTAPAAINDRLQAKIVGALKVADGTVHPFIWTRDQGMRDLSVNRPEPSRPVCTLLPHHQ